MNLNQSLTKASNQINDKLTKITNEINRCKTKLTILERRRSSALPNNER